MPNAIKYNTNAETLALKKGNFWIGNGSVGKGPTSSTGYYNGVAIPSGGYVIYSYTSSLPGNIAYFAVANDSQLISYTNGIAGQSYTTVNQCFTYYYSQTDKVCVSQDYPSDFPYIVLDGLVLYMDASITLSYPGNGNTWSDINGLGPKNNGTLINGSTYNSANGGSIVFDGVDDYVSVPNREDLDFPTANFTAACWFKTTQSANYIGLLGKINFSVGTVGWTLQLYQGTVTSWINDNILQSPLAYNDNNWHYGVMVCGVPNTGNRYIYVDGVQVTSSIMPNHSFDPTNLDLWIGGWTNGISYLFKGNIGSTQIYNRTLTASEVLQNYNAQKSRFGL
jgi:hypothetical protein